MLAGEWGWVLWHKLRLKTKQRWMETGAIKLRNSNTNRNGELHQKMCEYSAQVPIHFCCIVQSHLDLCRLARQKKKKKKKFGRTWGSKDSFWLLDVGQCWRGVGGQAVVFSDLFYMQRRKWVVSSQRDRSHLSPAPDSLDRRGEVTFRTNAD